MLFASVLAAVFLLARGPARRRARRLAAAAGGSAAVALLVAQVVSRLVEPPRPLIAQPGAAGSRAITRPPRSPSPPLCSCATGAGARP